MKKPLFSALLGFAVSVAAMAAHADAVDTLKTFVQDVKVGQAAFTQVVTSPDGAKKKNSSGTFEFARPNRFRFSYEKPYPQLIVGDGQKVWVHDVDLNQVTSRKLGDALGSTPAALLAGGAIDKDFILKALPDRDGLAWVDAVPKAESSAFKSFSVGFKGKELASLEITDSFGQRSVLQFSQWKVNQPVAPDRFKFVAPKGVDLIEQ